jgi:AcrR family transcriptional regulator
MSCWVQDLVVGQHAHRPLGIGVLGHVHPQGRAALAGVAEVGLDGGRVVGQGAPDALGEATLGLEPLPAVQDLLAAVDPQISLGKPGAASAARACSAWPSDLIIQKAFALLDEQGPGALSMRRLADHLGVAPNALYTHVRGKADLIDGLIDQVYAGIDPDLDLTKDWPEQLAVISQAVRAQFLAHPAVVPYAIQQPGLGPNSLRLGEAIYGVLRPAGFSDEATVGIVYALLTYILGFVALELPRAGTSPQTSDEFVRRLHGFFAALPPGEFPHTVQLPLC